MVDRYVYPGTNILVNRKGITDFKTLQDAERAVSSLCSVKIREEGIIGKFDVEHLKSIHRRLFGEIYDWAGEFRDIRIWKGGTEFAAPDMIERELDKLFTNIRRMKYLRGLPEKETAYHLADIMCRLNIIHPFREGNGRCQRLFVEQLALHAGYNLDFSKISENDMRNASRAASRDDNRLMRYLFSSNIKTVDTCRRKKLSESLRGAFVFGYQDSELESSDTEYES